MGAAEKLKGKFVAHNTHVPRSELITTQYGVKRRYVRCPDRRRHQYVNEGVPEGSLPVPIYGACAVCGLASAPMIGTVCKGCDECRLEEAMLAAEALEAEGIEVMPKRPDPIDQRTQYNFRETFQRSHRATPYTIGHIVGYDGR